MSEILYDTKITGIYLGITTRSYLVMDDGDTDDEIGMQTSPDELRAVARELVEYIRDPARYEGWCYGGGLGGEYELSVQGMLEITIEDGDDTVSVAVDVDDTADALGLAVILLDAAEALEA